MHGGRKAPDSRILLLFTAVSTSSCDDPLSKGALQGLHGQRAVLALLNQNKTGQSIGLWVLSEISDAQVKANIIYYVFEEKHDNLYYSVSLVMHMARL